MGKATAHLASSSDFRALLYHEIEAQFDGDYNVLVEALATMNSGSSTVGAQMITALGSEAVFSNALHAFKNLDGEPPYYPQIFIPSYETLIDKYQSGELPDLFSTAHTPTIVVYVADQEGESTLPGYQLDMETGELIALSNPIDEEYTENHEVWVLSLNESFNATNINGLLDPGDPDPGPITPAPSPFTPYDAIIEDMIVKVRKESFWGGKSDIHTFAILTDASITGPHTYMVKGDMQGWPEDHKGVEIRQFSKNEVKHKWERNVDFTVVNRWNFDYQASPYLNIVIFEYDVYPVGCRWATWQGGTGDFNWQYRSKDDYYDIQRIEMNNFCYHITDNSEIRWDVKQ